MNDFLNKMIKETGNEYAGIVSGGIDGSDVKGFIDTGSYAFNGLLSGSLYGGIADNKITALAGPSGVGKTFFALGICNKFLKDNPDGAVLYFDTEQAITSEMISERGLDTDRIAIFPVATVETFRHQAITIVDSYIENKEKKPILIILDSLGMLSTEKEMEDTAAGKSTRDMTRAQILKASFRVLTLKLGIAGIPLVMTNHTYDQIGTMYPTQQMSGGKGLYYSASTIIYLSRRKVKEGTDVVGNIIHCKLFKGRLTKENSMVDVMLNYDTGLNPYYGLVPIAVKYGIFKKVSTRIELPNGKTAFEKSINNDPEKYFTDDVMKQLEVAVAKEFKYGDAETENTDDEV
tara:strand:- start:482 stop:1522 length:1041 start_codon:yes stop_codon:yes gene_type:complete